MTYVVTESCIRCKYTDCVDVCPVDCFREGPNFLVIDPDECIDCTLCVAECPVEAIFAEDDVPDDQQQFTALNAELSKVWKPIIERKPAPADADDWKDVPRQAQAPRAVTAPLPFDRGPPLPLESQGFFRVAARAAALHRLTTDSMKRLALIAARPPRRSHPRSRWRRPPRRPATR